MAATVVGGSAGLAPLRTVLGGSCAMSAAGQGGAAIEAVEAVAGGRSRSSHSSR